MLSTGRHHGFESVAEQRLLLVLDFAAELTDVLAQPFRLRFACGEGWREHIPDFLALTSAGAWLIDVRPGKRIEDEDRVCFAAANEAALECGWRYTVVTGWRPHVVGTVDTVSAQRRPLVDQFELQARSLTQMIDNSKLALVAPQDSCRSGDRRTAGRCGRPIADQPGPRSSIHPRSQRT
jgi:hypothetical protein